MGTRVVAALTVCLVIGGTAGVAAVTGGARDPVPEPATRAARTDLSRLPVSFVANQGQADPLASWLASGPEASAYFVEGGLRWAIAPAHEG